MAKRVATAQLSPTAFFTSVSPFDPEARAVLEAAAVAVGAFVVELGEELQRQVAVRAVDVDDVEACPLGANRGVDVHLDQVPDVVLVGPRAG